MIEEIGKTVTSIADKLSGTPAILALVLMNIVFVLAVFLNGREVRASNDHVLTALLEQQKTVQQLLYNCTPNKPGG